MELKKRRRRVLLNNFFLLLFGFALFFVFLVYIFRLDNLNINEIKIIGNKNIDTETLKSAVKEQITGKYLWFFPKTNILYYPQNTIKNKLETKFKRLKDISLTIKDNKILEVYLIERNAKYIWCGTKFPEALLMKSSASKASGIASAEKCYFLDENGYLFDEAPYFSGEVYFKFYGLTNLDANNLLGSYFSFQNFQKLIFFKERLQNIGLKPTTLYISENGDIKIFLSEKTSFMKPEIIFKINSDFEKIAENLETALNTEPLQSNFKNRYSSLLYIDIRFENKVYYKFR